MATITLDTTTAACGALPVFHVTGSLTHFSSATTVDFGPGMVIDGVTATSSTQLLVFAEVLLGASPGAHPLTVTTGTEVVKLAGGFTVTTPCQALASQPLQSVSPSIVAQGAQNVQVTLKANHGFFKSGVTAADFGAGITVASLTISDANNATAVINVDPAAGNQTRTLKLTTNNNVVTSDFFVHVPVFVTVSPQTAACGTLPVFNVTPYGTQFSASTTIDFGPGIVFDRVQLIGNGQLIVYAEVLLTATAGNHTGTVTNGSQVIPYSDGINVTTPCQALPSQLLQSVNPSIVGQGAQNVQVAIKAKNGFFKSGVTTADFGAGITVASLTISDANNATAVINVDPAAGNQTRTLKLTTNNNVVTSDFFVHVPVFVTVSPQTAACGTSPVFNVTPYGTQFAAGATIDFGPGIVVDQVQLIGNGQLVV